MQLSQGHLLPCRIFCCLQTEVDGFAWVNLEKVSAIASHVHVPLYLSLFLASKPVFCSRLHSLQTLGG